MRSHCGLEFRHAKLRHQHQIKCTECIGIMDAINEATFHDRPRREYRESESESEESRMDSDGSTDQVSMLFLDNPRQRDLLAALLTSYEPAHHIDGLCYFEPDWPPPYFQYKDLVVPKLEDCVFRPEYKSFYVGWLREDYNTVVETWLVVHGAGYPSASFGTRRKVYSNYDDTEFASVDARIPLMPLQALHTIMFIFEDRHRKVMLELHRINRRRKEAYDHVTEHASA
jgi:hypothetical protein